MRGLGVCRALTVVTLLLPALGLAAAPTAAGAPTTAGAPTAAGLPGAPAADSRLQITLSSVSPTIAGPGQTVTVRGTVSNRGTSAVPRPVARVVLGEQPLPTREAVDGWAGAQGPAQGREVGRTPLGSSLPAGGTAAFVVNVKDAAGLGQATYGALPLSVEVAGSSLRTFAGYQRQKQYQPLRLGWVVPLTLDADPELFGPEGTARDAAWEKALGAGSRLGRVVESTESAPVTWALDPTLVPSLLPSDTGEPLSSSADGDTDEAALRSAVEERIRGAAAQHSPWVLPDTDADVAAVADAEATSGLMSELIGRSTAVARALDGRADVAWPADGRYTAAREDALRQLFSSQPRLGAQLAAQSTLPLGGNTQDAHRRSADGLPVLGYDDGLSALFAQTSSPAGASLGLQQFIADTVALLDERPGTSGRSVLVAAPRSFDPDPTAAAGFLQAVGGIPWLEPVSTSTLLADAKRAVPMPKQVGTRPTPQGTPTASTDPYSTKRPPLTPRRLRDLEESEQTVRGVGLIRDDGDAFTRTWGRAAEQLASSRWRAFPAGWTKLNAQITAATRETTSSIEVSRRNINVLAETGRLQITVTNDLDVAVENVKLTLEPANPRLRIDSQPPVMRIGANSRATAVVSVTTLAAGPVPIRTTLTTPDGTVIGQGADVLVQVTPTGDWVYWTLGGFAGIILLLGIWRSVRRKPEPVNAAEPLPTSQGPA
jgi:hypothetical protein